MANTILRLDEVKHRCGISRSAIYAAIQRGDFPSQLSLGPRSVGWLESAIEDWIASRSTTKKPVTQLQNARNAA